MCSDRNCKFKLTHMERDMLEHAVREMIEILDNEGDPEWEDWVELLEIIKNPEY